MPSVRGAGRALVAIVLLPVRALRWLLEQLVGGARNGKRVITETSTADLPPVLRGTIEWLPRQIKNAAGAGTPREQIVSSVALAITMIVASFGLLTWLAAIMIVPFLIGVIRLVPAVNDGWGRLGSAGGSARRRTRSSARKWRRK